MKLRITVAIAALLMAICPSVFAVNEKVVAKAVAPGTMEKVVTLQLHVQLPAEGQSAKPLHLKGSDARQQLLATARLTTGAERDFTRQVTYSVAPANIVQVDKTGLVSPVNDGTATITAKSKEGVSATIAVTVENAKLVNPVNFANQIVPIFTKGGCNGGGCHGKSSGQNGFRLSLLGFEPTEDFEHLVKEARGRRLFPASPKESLLLIKGAAIVAHGGGKRLEPDSFDWNLLVRWIDQGMPYGKDTDPKVAKIEVFPKERTMAMNTEQQLVVLATYTDGSTEDVTRAALYEPNDKDMASADNVGYVKMNSQPGDVAVMIRYQAKVAVFRATVPLGAPVETLPPVKNFIDDLVFAKLKRVGMPPSAISDDATFLRRVTLDIAGRVPTLEETKVFLASKEVMKREQLVDALLESSDYADFFASKWAALLRNKRGAATHVRGNYAFHDWIRDGLMANKPYDQFAREILAASGDIAQNPPVAWYRQVASLNTQLEDTAQLFLGLRLQCAQCHHHPYEKWSQQDYYSFGAFFSTVNRKPGAQPGEEIIYTKRGMPSATNKKTGLAVQPAGLGETPPKISPDEDPRQTLVDWMSRKDNPFFAQSLVNRYWKHFFNRGLVDPEDDMRETNPATNPELLQAVAKSFVDSGFDLKQLVRTICRSTTYQLSSIPNSYNASDKHYYSRYYPKRLQAEVLLDAINFTTKSEANFPGLPTGTRAVQLPDNSFNAGSYFLTVFGRPEMSSSCECERSGDASLAQSLHLLNSKDIQAKLSDGNGRAALLAADEKRTDDEKLGDLYQLAYSRNPESFETELGKQYIEKKMNKEAAAAAKAATEKLTAANSALEKDPKNAELIAAKTAAEKAAGEAALNAKPIAKRQAYEDIVWALVSSKEFLFNH